jgi:ribonuclease VapC
MMFVDACAIVSLMAGEDSAADYEAALAEGSEAWTSAVAAWEAIIVLSRADQLNCRYTEAEGAVVEWLEARDIALRDPPLSRETLAHAVAVAEKHGLGKRALSNFDCFHYAYAKAVGEPLLTLDRRLRATDVETLP